MLFALLGLAAAQDNSDADVVRALAPAEAAEPAPAPPAPTRIRTLAVEPNKARMGDPITLEVEGLPALLASVEGDCTALVLFVDGLPLTGNSPERCDPDSGHVGFVLARTDADDTTWHRLLGRPTGTTRDVQVTIGSAANRSYPRLNNRVTLTLEVLPPLRFGVFGVIGASVVASLLYLGLRTSLLRTPAGDSGLADVERPYNLGRVQQAFWLTLSLLGFTFVWLMTNELNSLTASVLGLIGISAGTYLGSEVVDASKSASMKLDLTRLNAERAAALSTAERSTNSAAATAAAEERAQTLDTNVAAVKAAMTLAPSRGFWRDLCVDSTGISLQRGQIVVWTLVLGVIFVFEVYAKLTMPEFGAELLALMGLSSGTFVAGKATEERVLGG